MFKSILVPIDVSHKSSWQTAMPEAIALAKLAGGKLAVVTVVRQTTAILRGVQTRHQMQTMIDEAHGKLSKILDGYRSKGIKIAEEVRFGSITQEIISTARKRRTDLIVMASHRPEMLDYLIGPNAAHVAAHAECSVLVLRRKPSQRQRLA